MYLVYGRFFLGVGLFGNIAQMKAEVCLMMVSDESRSLYIILFYFTNLMRSLYTLSKLFVNVTNTNMHTQIYSRQSCFPPQSHGPGGGPGGMIGGPGGPNGPPGGPGRLGGPGGPGPQGPGYDQFGGQFGQPK